MTNYLIQGGALIDCTGAPRTENTSVFVEGNRIRKIGPAEDVVAEQVTNGGGAMPPFKGTLTEEQITDVAAYVAAVTGS